MPAGRPVSPDVVKWIEAPPGAFRGDGLVPYAGETAHLMDWAENTNGRSAHLFAHRGQLVVDIVEIEPNAVHQPGKPGDELVLVTHGVLSATTDATGVEQTFAAGEMVMFPAGWAGIYRVTSENGLFRELAITPGSYFDPTHVPPPNPQSPRRLDLPLAAGKHELHRNTYLLEAENIDQPSGWSITASSDEVIQVLAGALTLSTAAETASFGPGSVVILPQGFVGEAETGPGYRALNARWIG